MVCKTLIAAAVASIFAFIGRGRGGGIITVCIGGGGSATRLMPVQLLLLRMCAAEALSDSLNMGLDDKILVRNSSKNKFIYSLLVRKKNK